MSAVEIVLSKRGQLGLDVSLCRSFSCKKKDRKAIPSLLGQFCINSVPI